MIVARHIAVTTTSRADWSHLRWPLQELAGREGFRVSLIATAAHLSHEFGQTVDEIRREGFEVHAAVESLMSSDSDVGMAKTIGVATLGLADTLGALRPDLLLVIADRYEMFAPAAVALALRIPMAHMEGGEISLGAIDDAVRNALTKMSHLHFTPTEASRQRVVAMGEEPWRVHRSGAPSLDELTRAGLPSEEELRGALGSLPPSDAVLVAYHPVTLAEETLEEADALFSALEACDRPLTFSFPNADTGSRRLIDRARQWANAHEDSRLYVNLNSRHWWGLMARSAALVGNSSAGLMEAPSVQLPTVNVGRRQEGRERGANVIDVAADADQIVAGIRAALDPALRAELRGLENPYGDGHASERIADVLESVPLGMELLLKKARPVPFSLDGEDA